ncbi:tol-pal system YbgF family protein [Kitasatospora aburaviensis]
MLDLAARLLPRAQAELGDGAPLVRTVRTIYARVLLQERRYRQALPEYRLLVATAEGGPDGPQAREPRYRAAFCLEQLGHGPDALDEYRALLSAASDAEPERAFDLRERIGLLLAAGGGTEAAWQWLLQLLFDRERRDGPHHPAVRRLRQTLDTLQPHRTTNHSATPQDPRATPGRRAADRPPPVPARSRPPAGYRAATGRRSVTTGRTLASISSRNRSGYRNAAKWPASGISAKSFTGAWTSATNRRASAGGVYGSCSPWKTKNGRSKTVPSAQSS